MRNANGLVSQPKALKERVYICECVLDYSVQCPTDSLGKLLTELTVAIRSTHATDHLARVVATLEKVAAVLHPEVASQYALETYVAFLPILVQVRSLVRDSRNDSNFFQLLIVWLTVCSRLIHFFLHHPEDPSARQNIQYIQTRVFEIASDDQELSLRSIICSALITQPQNCELIISVLSHLDSLAAATNSDPQTSYIETLLSALLVLPSFIQSTCFRSTSLLVQFANNHSPLVDKVLYQKFFTTKLFFLITHANGLLATVHKTLILISIDTLIDSQLPAESRVVIAKFIHQLIIGSSKTETNTTDSMVLTSPSRSITIPTLSLGTEQSTSPILSDPSISVGIKSKLIQLLLRCIFSDDGRKNFLPEFADEFPLINKQIPIIFHLFQFLSKQGKELFDIPEFPILRNLVSNRRKNNSNLDLVGSGQFGSVFVDKSTNRAIKFIKIPQNVHDRCTIVDVYNEVLAMHACKRDAFCLELIDWGTVCDDTNLSVPVNFFIESEAFVGSLTRFRSLMNRSPIHTVVLLIVFSEILAGVESLHKDAKIIHYDLKMDNILVEFGGPSMEDAVKRIIIPRIAIADFGEARVVEPDVTCVRNRGTECIKSPELLSMANKLKKDGDTFDRRRAMTTTYASDIWSLGCLFYELITGQYLYRNVDGNWVEFYYRVTGEGGQGDIDVLPEYAVKDLGDSRFVEFLRYLLVRDPDRRPNIDGAIKRFQKLYSSYIVDPTIFPKRTRIELPESIPGTLRINSE